MLQAGLALILTLSFCEKSKVDLLFFFSPFDMKLHLFYQLQLSIDFIKWIKIKINEWLVNYNFF